MGPETGLTCDEPRIHMSLFVLGGAYLDRFRASSQYLGYREAAILVMFLVMVWPLTELSWKLYEHASLGAHRRYLAMILLARLIVTQRFVGPVLDTDAIPPGATAIVMHDVRMKGVVILMILMMRVMSSEAQVYLSELAKYEVDCTVKYEYSRHRFRQGH